MKKFLPVEVLVGCVEKGGARYCIAQSGNCRVELPYYHRHNIKKNVLTELGYRIRDRILKDRRIGFEDSSAISLELSLGYFSEKGIWKFRGEDNINFSKAFKSARRREY